MQSTANRDQQVLVGRLAVELSTACRDAGEDLAGLLQKYAKQFGVDHLVGRARQFAYLLRRRVHGRRLRRRRDLLHGFLKIRERRRRGIGLVEQFQHAAGAALQGAFVD